MKNLRGYKYIEAFYDKEREELAFKPLKVGNRNAWVISKNDGKEGRIAPNNIYKHVGHSPKKGNVLHFKPYRRNGFVLIDIAHPLR